jgi:O-antigen/teichoic acid export membrane protein
VSAPSDAPERYGRARASAFVGVQALVYRHVLVGLLSAAGSTFIIRRLGPEVWGAFGVASLLVVTTDAILTRGAVGALARSPVEADDALIRSAARLSLLVGAGLATATLGVAMIIRVFYDPPAFLPLMVAAAAATCVYSLRAVSVALLERRVRYGPLAISDVVENVAFYAVAIPAFLAGYGLAGLAAALIARALAAVFVIRVYLPGPWLGSPPGTAARRLLPFGAPAAADLLVAMIDGLIPVFIMGRHREELGFVLVGGTVLGYGAAVITAASRVAVPSFSGLHLTQVGAGITRAASLGMFLTFSVLVPAVVFADAWVPWMFGGVWRGDGVVYMQGMGVAVLAAPLMGLLPGALLARGLSGVALRTRLVMLAVYVPVAAGAETAFGPMGCLACIVLSRWGYAVLLCRAAERHLGFRFRGTPALLIGAGALALGTGVALVAVDVALAAVVGLALAAGWLYLFRDLIFASYRAVTARASI